MFTNLKVEEIFLMKINTQPSETGSEIKIPPLFLPLIIIYKPFLKLKYKPKYTHSFIQNSIQEINTTMVTTGH